MPSSAARPRKILAVITVAAALLAGSAVPSTAVAAAPAPVAAAQGCVQDLYIGNYCRYYSGSAMTSRGQVGNRVKEIQALINAATSYSPKLTVDGNFGPATESAVRWFQSRKGLAVDGIVGKNTWVKLRTA